MHRTPRWVKVFGIVALVLVLLVLGLKAFGVGGDHGPGRHFAPSTGHAPPAGDHAQPGGDHGENSLVAAGASRIHVSADDLASDPREIAVRVGTDVAIVLSAVDARHDFTIDEMDAHVAAGPGETATGGFHAGPPGRYAFYCSVPGHREAGMEGTLVVTGGHG